MKSRAGQRLEGAQRHVHLGRACLQPVSVRSRRDQALTGRRRRRTNPALTKLPPNSAIDAGSGTALAVTLVSRLIEPALFALMVTTSVNENGVVPPAMSVADSPNATWSRTG